VVSAIPVVIVEILWVHISYDISALTTGELVFMTFIEIGLTEEFFKALAFFIPVYWSRHMNEPYDGIMYAVAAALGFAAIENVMYVMDGGMQTALSRALTAVPAHAIFGVTMGYYLGIAHMYEELKSKYLVKALLVPIVLHGIYDFILMVEIGWLLLMFIPYVIVLYSMAIKKMKRLSDSSIFKP